MSEADYFYSKAFSARRRWFKDTKKKILEGSKTALNKFFKPALKTASPFIGMAVSAKTKNPKVGQTTANILKSNMHSGAGPRLRVM